jgi:hypothetical protein
MINGRGHQHFIDFLRKNKNLFVILDFLFNFDIITKVCYHNMV